MAAALASTSPEPGEAIVVPRELTLGNAAEAAPVEAAGAGAYRPGSALGRSSPSATGCSRSTRHEANHCEHARTTADSSVTEHNRLWRVTGFARNEALRVVPIESDISSPSQREQRGERGRERDGMWGGETNCRSMSKFEFGSSNMFGGPRVLGGGFLAQAITEQSMPGVSPLKFAAV